MNDPAAERRYAFESLRFDAATHELHLPDGTTRLRPQASQALALLLSRAGEVVTRAELKDALWPDSRVVLFEGSIAAVIRELRRVLGDNHRAPRFIETIPKRGYRFIGCCSPPPEDEARVPVAVGGRAATGRAATGRALRALRALQGLALAGVLLVPGVGDRGTPRLGMETAPVRVAVHPFENLGRTPVDDLLSRSVARDLVGWLGSAQPERLQVIESEAIGPDTAARAEYSVHGDVRNDGDATVVAARLLDAEGGFVWGEGYRRDSPDDGLMSREVAARIAEAVLKETTPRRQMRGSTVPPGRADDALRRGMAGLALFSAEGTAQAVAAFEEAMRLAPGGAEVRAHLAQALIRWPGVPVTPERAERARGVAERAVSLDPENAVAQRVLGELHLFYDRDWERARQRLERSVELSPADASGHHSYSLWLSARGRHAEALREIDLAEALDPASVAISLDAMFMHFYARDFDGTVQAARRLRQLWPESGSAHRYIVLSLLATGEVAQAAVEARAVLADTAPTPEERRTALELGDAEALGAYWDATYRAFSRYVQEDAGDPTALALVYVQLKQPDRAIEALSRALSERRFSYFLPYLGVSPEFDSLCGDLRFERLLRRLGQAALSSESVDSRCASTIRIATGRS